MRVCVAVPNEINEDRLCHDQSLQRDEWPWIGNTYLLTYLLAHRTARK